MVHNRSCCKYEGDAVRAERVMHDHLMAQLVALKALREHEKSQGMPHHA
jgi:hypothetical protein